MKKVFAVIALVAFLGGVTVPAMANVNEIVKIESPDKDPKKAETKSEKKSSDCTHDEKKATAKKADAKSHDCATEKKATAKSEKKADGCGN